MNEFSDWISLIGVLLPVLIFFLEILLTLLGDPPF